MKKFFPLIIVAFSQIYGGDFTHPTDIVDKVKETFQKIETYSADFTIVTQEKKSKKTFRGQVYYKKGGKVNFTFSEPSGDIIISNGKKMWIYIKRLKAVGIQELKSPNDGGVYTSTGYEGVMAIFSRYHYSFDDPEQPRKINGKSYYVFHLKEKVASGGFSEMEVYVNSSTFLIERLKASNDQGKTVTLEYRNIKINPDLPGNLFYFKVEGGIQTVENPLTTVNE